MFKKKSSGLSEELVLIQLFNKKLILTFYTMLYKLAGRLLEESTKFQVHLKVSHLHKS